MGLAVMCKVLLNSNTSLPTDQMHYLNALALKLAHMQCILFEFKSNWCWLPLLAAICGKVCELRGMGKFPIILGFLQPLCMASVKYSAKTLKFNEMNNHHTEYLECCIFVGK